MGDRIEHFNSYDKRVGSGKKGTLVNDKMEGVWEAYEDNVLVSKITYKNGIKNGPCERYSEGKLCAAGNYMNGEEEGLWTYYENGIKSRTISFKKGLFDGPNAAFNPDGKLRYIMNYQNNILDGYCEDYQDGQLKHRRLYRNGEITPIYEEYDEQGKVKEKGYFDASGQEVHEYYQNNHVKERTIRQPNGTVYEYYDENGLLSRKNYQNENGYDVVENYQAGRLESRRLQSAVIDRILSENYVSPIGKKVS